MRNQRDIKLIITDKRRKRLVSEPNYRSHKKFSEHLVAILLLTLKPKMFLKIFLMMLRDGLIHRTMTKMIKDLFQ